LYAVFAAPATVIDTFTMRGPTPLLFLTVPVTFPKVMVTGAVTAGLVTPELSVAVSDIM